MLVYNVGFKLPIYVEKSLNLLAHYVSLIQMESDYTRVGKVSKFCEEEQSTKREKKRESCSHFSQINPSRKTPDSLSVGFR
jgi:hypothetical protein